jgi:hypothetical protein
VRFQAQRGTLFRCGILLSGLVLGAQPARAQEVPVEPEGPVALAAWAGFQFTSAISTSGGTISIDPAPSYGAALTLAVVPELEFEFLWTISSTEAHILSSAGAAGSGQDHLNVNYFQVGLTKTIRCAEFECFGDATIGAVLLSPGDILLNGGQRLDVHDTWRAAFTFGAGIRFHLIDRLAVVLQARLLVPFFITTASFYAGNGSSVLVVTAGVPCVQGAFSGGLVLTF